MHLINKISSASPVDFAAEELKKYLRMMMPEGGDVKIAYNPEAGDGFRLGLMEDFGLDVSDVLDTELDDIIYIDCDECGGVIAGSNPRSVLLSVYEYLRRLGCRWLLPGIDGEYIPMRELAPVKYRHAPKARYRGNCIEGATGQRMLLDFIDFLPKLGLNTFLIQFKIPATFYDRHYTHEKLDGLLAPEPITLENSLQWTRAVECEMARRGLMLHSYGHGFTQDPFDIGTSTGWQSMSAEDIPKEKRELLAMVSGERKFFGGKPLNTNVCMSNPTARALIKNYVRDYCARHTNVDFLHVWLADNYNNHCECESCKRKAPVDWYVTLLNEIDEELTRSGLKNRIVFISYEETIWAPVGERLKNPDRFSLMIAPITRDFTYTLDKSITPSAEKFELNKIKLPRDLGTYLAYFGEWKKVWGGRSFVFDYHVWMAFHYDISGLKLARVSYDDNKLFSERGLDGTIECGTQRCFFPTGIVEYTHARMLFDESLSFEDIVVDYFSAAFGEDYEKFVKYLYDLENTLPYVYLSRLRRNITLNQRDVIEKLRRADEVIDVGRELIRSHYNSDVRVRTVSVRILEYHIKYTESIVKMILSRIDGDEQSAKDTYAEMLAEYARVAHEFEYYVDPYQTFGEIGRILRNKIEPSEGDLGEDTGVMN